MTAIISIPLKDGTDFPIQQKDVDLWEDTFPHLNVLSILKEIRTWNVCNPAKRKTKRGIMRHIFTWMSKQKTTLQTQKTFKEAFNTGKIFKDMPERKSEQDRIQELRRQASRL